MINTIQNYKIEDFFNNLIKTLTKNDLKNIIIITDPPYNIGYRYENYNDRVSEKDYNYYFELMKDFKSVIINYPEITIRHVIPQINILLILLDNIE
jgi:hypothetical protein